MGRLLSIIRSIQQFYAAFVLSIRQHLFCSFRSADTIRLISRPSGTERPAAPVSTPSNHAIWRGQSSFSPPRNPPPPQKPYKPNFSRTINITRTTSTSHGLHGLTPPPSARNVAFVFNLLSVVQSSGLSSHPQIDSCTLTQTHTHERLNNVRMSAQRPLACVTHNNVQHNNVYQGLQRQQQQQRECVAGPLIAARTGHSTC